MLFFAALKLRASGVQIRCLAAAVSLCCSNRRLTQHRPKPWVRRGPQCKQHARWHGFLHNCLKLCSSRRRGVRTVFAVGISGRQGRCEIRYFNILAGCLSVNALISMAYETIGIAGPDGQFLEVELSGCKGG